MIYLICAIVFSALVSIIMRAGESKIKSTFGMFVANYVVCMILAIATRTEDFLLPAGEGSLFVWGLGLISGVLFLLSFVLLQINIQKNGVVLAAVFMKLGLIVSILIAILAFKEVPGWGQVIGIGIAIVAIFVFNIKKNGQNGEDKEKKIEQEGFGILLLLLLLLCSGVTDSMANIYDKLGPANCKDDYLLIVFAVAALCALLMKIYKKEAIGRADLVVGCLLGIPNYFSSKFLLLALGQVNAVVVYPVYSVATVVLITLAGVLFFKERLDKQKIIGIALVSIALILLNQ